MTKKKPAAQLNREIDMALRERDVAELRQARSDPSFREPAVDALLERGYSLERAKKAVLPYAKGPRYRHFTVKIYPGRSGAPRLLWFRAVPSETWSAAKERLIAAGIIDGGLAGRTSERGGWMLSVSPADYDEVRAKSLP